MKAKNNIFLFVAVFIFILGLCKLTFSIRDSAEHDKVNWQPTAGTIVSINAERYEKRRTAKKGASRSSTYYRLNVSYSYLVDGVEKFSDKKIEKRFKASQKSAILKKYKEGGAVELFYDAENENSSYLREFPPNHLRKIVASIVIMVFSIIVAILLYRGH